MWKRGEKMPLYDEVETRMTEEGCPNAPVTTIPDSTGYSGDTGALGTSTPLPGKQEAPKNGA
jgi:hypothetical protein